MTSARSTDTARRTQEEAVADQIDCDLDNMVRRCYAQAERAPKAKAHWEMIARHIDSIRGDVRKRMHKADRKATQ